MRRSILSKTNTVNIPKLVSIVFLALVIPACSDEPAQQASASSQTSMAPPGIERLARTIDINSLQSRIVLTIDGAVEEIEVLPVGSKDGVWVASFLVPQDTPFTIENIWSAVGVDGHLADYARLERTIVGVSQNSEFDLTLDGYDTSAARFDNDADGASNFEELTAGTPAVLSPVAYFPLDNGEALDLSGSNQHGVVIGTVAATDENGDIDSAIRIGKSTDRIVLPDEFVDGLRSFTVLSKIKFDDFNAGDNKANVILSVATAREDNELTIGYALNETGTPIVDQFYIVINGGSFVSFARTDFIARDTWYCIAVYRDNALAGLVVDGNAIGPEFEVSRRSIDADSGGVIVGQEQDALGDMLDVDQALVGSIDELFFFDRALNIQEIQTLCS